jgi:3-deoxy-D-manno-octulosonic-acid transferase
LSAALTAWGWAIRLATPLLMARWWWRGRVEPGYRVAMPERLGFYKTEAEPGRLWLHAVSLGETLAAAPLIEALRAGEPGLRLLLTHTTATGREAGLKLLREGDAQCWLPLDTPGATRRFFAHWRPRLGVLMETEVWPQLLAASTCAVWQANARLSERSLSKGRRFEALLRPAAQRLTGVLAQTEADAERLRAMGARQVRVAGNLKYELSIDEQLLARGRAWKREPRLLWAVTREGEEALLLAAWQALPTRPKLIVVPRHPQRFDEVAALFSKAGLRVSRRSSWVGAADHEAEVWIGDSLGEMPAYYAAAELALLGGSFLPLGGQNLIQAAACACPLLMGPSTFNFADAAEGALVAGAAERVADADAALRRAAALMDNSPARREMAQAGLRFAAAHRGAAQRMAEAILA